MDSPRPTDVRCLVRNTLQSFQSGAGPELHETLLIRDGHYCGHRYQFGDYSAVWFLEEDQVKFYSSDRSVLTVLRPSEHRPTSIARAA